MWRSATDVTRNPKAIKYRASTFPRSFPTIGRSRMTANPPGESAIPASCAE